MNKFTYLLTYSTMVVRQRLQLETELIRES